jgi:hypothetical protein
VAHHLVAPFQSGGGDTLNKVDRCSSSDAGIVTNANGLSGGLRTAWVRQEHTDVAGLGQKQCFGDGGGSRIGAGSDTNDGPHRSRNLGNAMDVVPFDDADGLGVLITVPDKFRGESVLQDLDSQNGEGDTLLICLMGDLQKDLVHSLLIEIGKLLLGLLGPSNHLLTVKGRFFGHGGWMEGC